MTIESTIQQPNPDSWSKSLKFGFYLEQQPDEDIRSLRNDPRRYVELLINPESYTRTDPYASSVRPTQSGSYVSTNGWYKKDIAISGQTGLRPAPNVTGQAEFRRLKSLFDLWADRSRTNQYAVLHWFSFKDDEFWQIEPVSFTLRRSKSAPFSYKYEISFTGVAPSVHFGQKTLEPVPRTPVVFIKNTQTSLDQMQVLINKGPQLLRNLSGTIHDSVQKVLSVGAAVISVVADTQDALRQVSTDLALNVLLQFNAAVEGTVSILIGGTLNFAVQTEADVNEFILTALSLGDDLTSYFDELFDNSGAGNAVAQLGQDPDADLTASLVNDQVTAPGAGATSSDFLAQIPNIERYVQATLLAKTKVFTGETIYDVALRKLGSSQAYLILVSVNGLVSPYIVADAANKPPGTIAYGEDIFYPVIDDVQQDQVDGDAVSANLTSFTGVLTGATSTTITDTAKILAWSPDQYAGYLVHVPSVGNDNTRVVTRNTSDVLTVNRPWTVTPSPGQPYQLVYMPFELRGRPNPDELTYGVDLLAQFIVVGGEVKVDLVLGPDRDLATIAGFPNFEQAMTILCNADRGSYPLHPTFGLSLPIGEEPTDDVKALFAFDVRRNLLKNGKIASVASVDFTVRGDVVDLSVQVVPITAGRARLFQRSFSK